MPYMTIRAINSEFESSDERDFADLDEAYQTALAAGLEIAVGELLRGKPACMIDLAVDAGGRRGVRRGVVSLATAPLKSEPPAND